MNSCNHVILLLRDQVTSLDLEVLFVLTLGLFDVVAEGLLLDAGSDHFLLVLSQLFVGDRRLGRLRCTILVVRFIIATCLRVVLLEVLGIPERSCSVQIGLQGSLHVRQLSLHTRVPVILDRVVCATLEHLGDFGPLVVHNSVHQEQDPLLLLVPVDLLDAGVEVVVPALTALFSNATIQVLGDECPLLRSIGHH